MLSDVGKPKKEDMRVWKTYRALITTMRSLLEKHKFSDLTVDRICRDGCVGRATFYAHFTDIYDLLKLFLSSFFPYQIDVDDTYEDVEKNINQFIRENKVILLNLLTGADNRVVMVLTDFLCTVFQVESEKSVDGKTDPKYAVASNLYAGGVANYLLWQIRHKFPPNVPMMNKHLYGAIKTLREWEQKK